VIFQSSLLPNITYIVRKNYVKNMVAGHFAERRFAERHFAERYFAERTF
jgi:hypothetical protein